MTQDEDLLDALVEVQFDDLTNHASALLGAPDPLTSIGDLDVVGYLGGPIHDPQDRRLGALCVIEAEPELPQVDLASLARQTREALKTRLRESGAVLHLGPLPPVAASEAQLRILLQSFLGNAIKFRADGRPATISVTAETGADARRLATTDNGNGIAKQSIERVQKLFQQPYLRTDIPGLGIGLVLSRRIAENRGAKLVPSSEIRRGTTASIDLWGLI